MDKLDTWLEFIKPIIGLLGFGGCAWLFYSARRKKLSIPSMESSVLIERLRTEPTPLFKGLYLQELKTRGEDIRFACPILMKDALSSKSAHRIMAWAHVRGLFPEEAASIEFNPTQPTKQSMDDLRLRITALLESNENS